MQVTLANFSAENIKWCISLDFSRCCNANMYSRMADKLSKGSNSSTFKTVSTYIGVIGMHGKAPKYEKLQNWQQSQQQIKTKKWWVNHIWKKNLSLFDCNVYDICVPPRINTSFEKRVCHKMSNIHTAWSLLCQILTGQCTTALTNQKVKPQKRDKLLQVTLIFCCTLLVKTCCQNNAIESHKSVINVIKIRGIAFFFLSMCISVGASCGILWLCIYRSKTENMWKK